MSIKVVSCFLLLMLVSASPGSARPASDPPRLYPQISLSRTDIAFAHSGDIWVVSRHGGTARQLTSGLEEDSNPVFSPDGTQIAFSRAGKGDADVYVMPASGGTPRRLSFHPASEFVRGWTPDGRSIIFVAARLLPWGANLYTVAASGGASRMLPIARALAGTYLPDGRFVFQPREVFGSGSRNSWRGYRGGTTAILMMTDLSGAHFKALSSGSVNDRFPVLAGRSLLIASDRIGGILNIFSLDPDSGETRPITKFLDVGIDALAGGPDGMAVFVRNGRIHLIDPASGVTRVVPVRLSASRAQAEARSVDASKYISAAALGADGSVALAARGDLFLTGVNRPVLDVTNSTRVVEDRPSFSADGSRLAFFSTDGNRDRLLIRELPTGRTTSTSLPSGRGGWESVVWSPDGKWLAVEDLRGGLWLVDARSGTATLITQASHMKHRAFEAVWGPESERLVYADYLPNHNRALFLYAIGAANPRQLTAGEEDVGAPVFNAAGDQLYFTASGNAAVGEAFGMTSEVLAPWISRDVMVGKLSRTAGVSEREFRESIRPVGLEPRDYQTMSLLPGDGLLASAREWPSAPGSGDSSTTLYRLSSSRGDAVRLAANVEQFALASDARQLLIKTSKGWSILSLSGEAREPKPLPLAGMKLRIDPTAEWRQIYHSAWRAARDTFYDPAHHGQDTSAIEARFAAYLPSIMRRSDLTTLLYQALGNLSVSHIAISGGDPGPSPEASVRSGLLGADFAPVDGLYRIVKILSGNPYLGPAAVSPLAGHPGGVTAGDYLLSVDGVEVSTEHDLQEYLLGKAGQKATLVLASQPHGGERRTVVLTPSSSEDLLREASWVEGNRSVVDARSGGSLGYVYVTDYQTAGLAGFIRQWTAATRKPGVLIDQRFNPGGWAADFVLDMVRRRPLSYYAFRDSPPLPFPVISNRGPVGLLVNHANGSASDTFPWLFKRAGAGPVIGTRTGGAGVGHLYSVGFSDGGEMTLPLRAFFNPDGSWDIENHGVAPDIDVEEDQAALLRGEDVQLEAAVDALIAARAKDPPKAPRLPQPLRYPPQSRH